MSDTNCGDTQTEGDVIIREGMCVPISAFNNGKQVYFGPLSNLRLEVSRFDENRCPIETEYTATINQEALDFRSARSVAIDDVFQHSVSLPAWVTGRVLAPDTSAVSIMREELKVPLFGLRFLIVTVQIDCKPTTPRHLFALVW